MRVKTPNFLEGKYVFSHDTHWYARQMSKQQTLFNVFKPSSSKTSQDENDSEGTATASTSSTSGERKRKQQAAAAVEAKKAVILFLAKKQKDLM